ncbi:CBS domain-containing protein [Lichenifustis flavocetrariae]|uniref:CBS domain-containing protein n=1 Tax=Lichenifustis flavocetrariae TaxID=2949735 RepID=A0AA41YSI0_9HYPH|nr:CBS domain-containing protein [Lichenifustis flavocetrariae]MCW6507761.1 CBS domain-containing protein [Lichenifustis flavocetrariae]
MKIIDVMSDTVEFVAAEASVKDAAELMGELDVGGLPVGTPENIEGMLTDRDILFRVVAAGLDPASVRVGAVTSRPAITGRDVDTLQTAMDLMMANHIRRLPIRNDHGRVTGVVTLADLARKLLVDSELLQSALSGLTESEDQS